MALLRRVVTTTNIRLTTSGAHRFARWSAAAFLSVNSLPRLRIAALALGAALVGVPSTAAEKAAAHEHSPGTPAALAFVSEAWGQINGLRAKLAGLVEGKVFGAVHGVTETLTATVKALPAISKDLPADKLKRLEGAVNNPAKALDAAHDAADETNQAATEKQLKSIELIEFGATHMQGVA